MIGYGLAGLRWVSYRSQLDVFMLLWINRGWSNGALLEARLVWVRETEAALIQKDRFRFLLGEEACSPHSDTGGTKGSNYTRAF